MGTTHGTVDSAYESLDLALARAGYLVAAFQAGSDAEQTRFVRRARAALRDDRPRLREFAALAMMAAVALDELAVTGASLAYGEFLPEER